MERRPNVVLSAIAALATPLVYAHTPHECPPGFPDQPVITEHIDHADLASGKLDMHLIREAGAKLFIAPFNLCDGQGRPATTGTGAKRVPETEHFFLRTSGPDANACAGCHSQPLIGGAGDFVANVFVLAQAADPVIETVSSDFSNERNTLGMFGAGPIEMLAREMTADLQAQAAALTEDGDHTLTTKGVDFEVTRAGGLIVSTRGVNSDLIVRPFHQAGVVVSLREFSDNAYNHHHGMQAEERFDMVLGDPDFDEDGYEQELTVGDITAVTLWQAQLPIPQQVLPLGGKARAEVALGEKVFDEVGCTSCHVPELKLNSTQFVEPNPYNPPGTCSDLNVCPEVSFDMTTDAAYPRLERDDDGGAVVRAYTDLKRHNLCDDEGTADAIRFFCNEKLTQGRPAQDSKPGTEFFLTRKLWDVGNSAPYGHRGDLTTITEAILAHGGEGRGSRDSFVARMPAEQAALVAFLKTLQVVTP